MKRTFYKLEGDKTPLIATSFYSRASEVVEVRSWEDVPLPSKGGLQIALIGCEKAKEAVERIPWQETISLMGRSAAKFAAVFRIGQPNIHPRAEPPQARIGEKKYQKRLRASLDWPITPPVQNHPY